MLEQMSIAISAPLIPVLVSLSSIGMPSYSGFNVCGCMYWFNLVPSQMSIICSGNYDVNFDINNRAKLSYIRDSVNRNPLVLMKTTCSHIPTFLNCQANRANKAIDDLEE